MIENGRGKAMDKEKQVEVLKYFLGRIYRRRDGLKDTLWEEIRLLYAAGYRT